MDELTVPEVVRVLKRVEPRINASAKRVRYATAIQGLLDPTHPSLGPGDAWRFSIYDIAAIRLLFQVQFRTSSRIAWGVFTYLHDALLEEFRSLRLTTVLVLDGPRAYLVSGRDARTLPPHVEQFPLIDAFRDLGDAVNVELKGRLRQERRVPMWKTAELTPA